MIDLVAVVGQTATGKSQLAMRIAQHFSGEIIAADSRTVYEGLDIGTAKPTLDDQKLVRHHLLDVLTPSEHFSVADFQQQASASIRDIQGRGRLPLLVGGSGLYVDSILYDYSFNGVGRNGQLRQELLGMTVAELQAKVRELNLPMPTNPKNKRYLSRTIERGGAHPVDREMIKGALVVGLSSSKDVLEQSIRGRLQDMLQAGLLDEADRLIRGHSTDSESLKSNIYRALVPYFKHETPLEEALEHFVQLDLRLAKKQLTWFKRNSRVVWFEDSLDDAYHYLVEQLQK